MPQRIETRYAIAAMVLAGIAIALFLHFSGLNSESTDRFADRERQGIYESGLAACIGRAQAEVAGAQPPVPMEAIEAYCECAMGGVVEQLTDAEIGIYNETDTLSDETTAKMATVAEACSQQFLPN